MLEFMSPSLAALLTGTQEQWRSLQEGMAGQMTSMDRLQLTLLSWMMVCDGSRCFSTCPP